VPQLWRSGAVSVGNFDGVHLGHARLIERLLAVARRLGGPAVVFTFDPHPAELLAPHAVPPPLTCTERKAELLTALGVDGVIAYPTDRAILAMLPDAFFGKILRAGLDVRGMVEGPNFYFGRGRSGSIEHLAHLCQAAGVVLEVVEPLAVDGQYVSSSRIRELIQSGDVRAADRLLTQPYRVHGRVVPGARRGSGLGFPTANIEPVGMVLPPLGVYAGRAWLQGAGFAAAIHIGPNPTFGEEQVKFEVHLIGYDRPLYGEELNVDFLDRLRDIRVFDDVVELQQQLGRDVEAARRVASG
jgi:riboflavin kinase/FMN adenylyltransferase